MSGNTGDSTQLSHGILQPRDEAFVRDWRQLTSGQRGAVQKACNLLETMAERSAHPARRVRDSYLRFEPNRLNHVILFDGARGTGKTTALMHLLDGYHGALVPPHRRRVDDLGDATLPPGCPSFVCGHSVLIPLPILDLHPLNGDDDLLLAIARRLRSARQLLDKNELERRDPRRTITRFDDAWSKLVDGVAMSVTSGKERRAKQGPDVIAVELRGQYYDLEPLFSEMLDMLVEELKDRPQHANKVPFFVLSIDDADLFPKLTFDLVKILRSLSHPRLAFLLTGDTPLFIRGLRAHIARSVDAGSASRNSRGDGAREEVDPDVLLAVELHDRVVPRLQRCCIERDDGTNPLDGAKTFDGVYEQLGKLPVRRWPEGTEISTSIRLADILLVEPRAARRVLRLPRAIPSRLRVFQDVRLQLKSRAPRLLGSEGSTSASEAEPSAHSESTDATWRALDVLWNAAVDGCGLPPPDEARLRACARLVEHDGVVRYRIDGRALEVRAEMEMLTSFPVGAAMVELYAPFRYVGRMGPFDLNQDLVQTLALVVDATRFDALTTDIGGPPCPRPSSGHFVASRVLGRDGEVLLPWPTPTWSFLQMDRFATLWRALAKRMERPIHVGKIFIAYVRLVVRVSADPNGDASAAVDELLASLRVPEPVFHGVATELRGLAEMPEQAALRRWALSLGSLVSPVYGLPPTLRENLARELTKVFLEDLPLRAEATAALDRAVKADLFTPTQRQDAFAQLDALLAEPVRAVTAEDKLAVLRAVPCNGGSEDSWFTRLTPSSLAGYIEPLRERLRLLEDVELSPRLQLPRDARSAVDELAGVWSGSSSERPKLIARKAPLSTDGRRALDLHWSDDADPVVALATRLRADVLADGGHRSILTVRAPDRFGGYDDPDGAPRWPAPAFPAPFDHESFIQDWNAFASGSAGGRDAIAEHYVILWHRVALRDPSAQLDLGGALHELLRPRTLETTYEEAGGRRWRAFKEFRRMLPVLAAPEFLLGEQLQTHILEIALDQGRRQDELEKARVEFLAPTGNELRRPAKSPWVRLLKSRK